MVRMVDEISTAVDTAAVENDIADGCEEGLGDGLHGEVLPGCIVLPTAVDECVYMRILDPLWSLAFADGHGQGRPDKNLGSGC